MLRRVHTPRLRTGEIALDPAASRHVRNVLRLTEGTPVEVFDDAGATAQGEIVRLAPEVAVRIEALNVPSTDRAEMIIASAVPKGDRADWMIEKLSELGCTRFIPLATARSVVHPEGKNKRDRWTRLATESAKQSRRSGVMRIDDLTPLKAALDEAVAGGAPTFVLSTDPGAMPIVAALSGTVSGLRSVTMFIGPEGGWTDEEIALFGAMGARGLKLTQTVLRIETAAVATAAVVAVVLTPLPPPDAADPFNPRTCA